MTAAVIIVCAILLVAIAIVLFRLSVRPRGVPLPQSPPEIPAKKKIPCILCGAPLERRENIKSKRVSGEKEDIVFLYGCPRCYGDAAVNERKCPVCKGSMGREDYLVGRMWKTKRNRLHLHVSGCTKCR